MRSATAGASSYGAQVAAVISNRADAGGLAFAREQPIATEVVDHKRFATREAFDAELAAVIDRHQPAWWCWPASCASSRPVSCERYQGRLLNIHPSLLPAFPGLHTHQRAIDAGCKFAGATVHQVTAELDHGPILDQAVVPVLPGDTAETLAARVLTQEHLIYPRAIAALLPQPVAGSLSRRLPGKPRLSMHRHFFVEHRSRAHPKPVFAVERAVQRHRLQRLAVAHGVQHLVEHALVVAVSAGRGFDQGRQRHGRTLAWKVDGTMRPMHPKALLDACAELVKLTLKFDHPADAVVSRYFRDNRSLGPRERATLAETVYSVLRKKLLFDHLSPSGSGPKERRMAILGFHGPRDFLKSALTDQEKNWLDQCDADQARRPAGAAPPQPAGMAGAAAQGPARRRSSGRWRKA